MFEPLQLEMSANASINGESFTVLGTGVVRSPGVYSATLNFSALAPDFPPALLATFLTSACCNSGASERTGSLNLGHTGVTSYSAKRVIKCPAGGSIEMTASASLSNSRVKIHAEVSGNLKAQYSRYSHAIYYITATPSSLGNKINGIGEGSIFDSHGNELKVEIDQLFNLDEPQQLPNPLKKQEFRILTEDGELIGLCYLQRIHSVCEPTEVFGRIKSLVSMYSGQLS